jgi:quinol monooxygenase YgiN
VQEFRIAYGPEGEWAEFFRRDPAYLRTDLLQDRNNPARFLTLDFWSSQEACASFQERFAAEFAALDKSFEHLTIEEAHVGDFDLLGP